jgi:hypothetical protein
MKKLFFTLFYLSYSFCYAQIATSPKVAGTTVDPYQIESQKNLYWVRASDKVVANPNQEVRNNTHYIQTLDIDASIKSGAYLDAGVTISSNATDNTICSGTSVTFTATPSGTGATNYQWKKNGIAISGATSSTYTTSDLVNGDAISVQLSVNSGTIYTTNSVMHLDAGNPSSYPGTGSTWTDISGNNNNANLPSALVSSYSSTIGLGSFNFQANSAYAIQSSAMNNWNITTTDALSVETWIKRTNYGNYQFWFSTPDLYYRLGVNPSGYLFWDMAHYVDRSVNVLVSEGAWHYIVYTAGKESGNITTRVYLDGALVATQNEGITDLSPFTNYLIGDGQTPGWHPLNGNMGLMRVFNSTLTAANVLQNYNAEIDRFTNGLFISNTITFTVNPIPTPVIDGLSTVTSGQTNVLYTTAAGMANYNWSVTGGNVTAGGGTANNTITITWGANGTGHVNVNYTNAGGCTAATQTDFPVSIFNKTSLSAGNWNDAGSWTPAGVPTINENVTVLHDITVSNHPTAVCNSLTITSGSVTINANQALTVNGSLTNNAGNAGLEINSGGSLIQNNSGVAATVKRTISGDDKFHLFISPINESIAATGSSCFSGAYVDRYQESAGEWVRLATGNNIISSYGYSINFENGSPELTFPGTLKTSPVSLNNLSYTAAAPGYGAGWNLMGNPYPCGINTALLPVPTGMNATAYVWDEAGSGNYIPFTIGAASATPGIIAPLQGFFVNTTSATNTLTLADAAKVHGGLFLKNSNSASQMLILSIAGNGYSDKTYVRFHEAATENFDQLYDAYKLSGLDEAPQLYSIIPNEKAAINSLPTSASDQDVSLGLKVGETTTYTISVEGISSFDPNATIQFYDQKTGYSFDLHKQATYTFTASSSDPENRFKLRFATTTGLGEGNSNSIHIYAENTAVNISCNATIGGTVYLYSVSGQLLAKSVLNAGKTSIPCPASGIYLVKVITGKSAFTRKIVVVD